MKLVYDIETNGLTPDTIHCLVAKDLNTYNIYKFSDVDPAHPGILDGIRLLEKADVLIGHNIISFDNYWIKKLYNIDLYKIKCYDTLIMSQVLRYKRNHKHGLGSWGDRLGNHKIEFDNWTSYSKEMMRYCVQDVNLNQEVFKILYKEYQDIYKKKPINKRRSKDRT